MSSEPPRSFLDQLLLSLSLFGSAVLLFVSGAAVQHYGLVGSDTMKQMFMAGDAWFEREKERAAPAPSEENLDKAFDAGKVSSWDKAKAFDGYTLITTWQASAAYLIDMEGKVAHKWRMPFSQAFPNPKQVEDPFPDNKIFWEKAVMLPNGDLIASYITIGDTPYGYGMVKIDKDSKLLWSYDNNTHHDIYVDEQNGSVYALAQAFIKAAPEDVEWLPIPALLDYIIILSGDGQEIRRISLLDAFLNTPYESLLRNNPQWDLFHANSIAKLEPGMASKFPMFKKDYILVSIRSINALAAIDPVRGKVAWLIKGEWRAQHAAHFLNNGNILLFDNRGYSNQGKEYSRALEIDPATGAIKWSYGGAPEELYYTKLIGRVQRLANQNTMVTVGMKARIFEVTPDKKIVWDYRTPNMKITKQDGTEGSKGVTLVSAVRYSKQEAAFLQEK